MAWVALVSGCGTPPGSRTDRPPAPSTARATPVSPRSAPVQEPAADDPAALAAAAVVRRDPGAVELLLALAFDHADDPAFTRRWIEGVRGFELNLLGPALVEAAREARDVGPALHDLGEAIGREGSDADRVAALREMVSHECCLRRSFLAAALDGLADGLGSAAVPPGPQAEAAGRIRELSGNADPGVAAAARRLGRVYREPEPGPEPEPVK